MELGRCVDESGWGERMVGLEDVGGCREVTGDRRGDYQ